MPPLKEFLVRVLPIAGCMIMAGYAAAITKERTRRLMEGYGYYEDVNDAKLYSFMSKSGEKINIHDWENKRVEREWEKPEKEK